ncbi:hypothetical protein [Saccharomonospora glauca]|uniref:Uncharacterized protein n=1 Tax=Saccharomonospora glauca K62 TaxID=928724 RepID=I1CZV7_9PSEU|nr:hypothetical protein [Saccharomonospora glauca]EIE98231.1 hypothetical protein SacglDRAFT_01303 [Saccharomonospora glauca K62]
MATTEQTSESAAGDRRAASGGMTGGSASAERLVERASALRVRAPELALILGERAAAVAEACGDNELWIRAESLAVHSKIQLGHRASTVGRAVTALRAAEDAGHSVLVAQLRTDLAVCARSVGAPLTGLAALRPVLTVGGLSSVQRAAALCHLVGCLGTFGRKAELDRVLMEGDRLISRDSRLSDDDRLVARALLRVGVSAHRRRHGDLVSAADAARTGIGFLDDLSDPGADGGLARVRLVLELVCSLLDRGDVDMALEVAEPLLAQPERAAAVAPMAWLRMAVATRVHLVNGSAETAARTLREAVHSASRHGLYSLTARLWLELAHVEERIGQASEAVQCLYRARSAEHLYTRVSSQARALLTGVFGAGEQAPVDLAEMVAAAAQAASASAAPQPPAQRTSSEPSAETFGRTGGRRRADERDGSSRPRVVLPMLRLAPPPADEEPTPRSEPTRSAPANVAETPAPRRSEDDDVSATEVTAVTPVITDDTPPPEPRRRRRKPEPEEETSGATRKTRHDAEHGSVTARSVLDRLGISPGGGGRRRADKDKDKDKESVASLQRAVSDQPESSATDSSPSRPEPVERTETTTDSSADSYGWLPRLKLPPSLAPVKEETVSATESSVNGSSGRDTAEATSDHTEQFSSGPSTDYRVPADDPPPDAGLAELLARALAEHQAGTASAAALVRQLGVDDDQSSVNGKHRGNG